MLVCRLRAYAAPWVFNVSVARLCGHTADSKRVFPQQGRGGRAAVGCLLCPGPTPASVGLSAPAPGAPSCCPGGGLGAHPPLSFSHAHSLVCEKFRWLHFQNPDPDRDFSRFPARFRHLRLSVRAHCRGSQLWASPPRPPPLRVLSATQLGPPRGTPSCCPGPPLCTCPRGSLLLCPPRTCPAGRHLPHWRPRPGPVPLRPHTPTPRSAPSARCSVCAQKLTLRLSLGCVVPAPPPSRATPSSRQFCKFGATPHPETCPTSADSLLLEPALPAQRRAHSRVRRRSRFPASSLASPEMRSESLRTVPGGSAPEPGQRALREHTGVPGQPGLALRGRGRLGAQGPSGSVGGGPVPASGCGMRKFLLALLSERTAARDTQPVTWRNQQGRWGGCAQAPGIPCAVMSLTGSFLSPRLRRGPGGAGRSGSGCGQEALTHPAQGKTCPPCPLGEGWDPWLSPAHPFSGGGLPYPLVKPSLRASQQSRPPRSTPEPTSEPPPAQGLQLPRRKEAVSRLPGARGLWCHGGGAASPVPGPPVLGPALEAAVTCPRRWAPHRAVLTKARPEVMERTSFIHSPEGTPCPQEATLGRPWVWCVMSLCPHHPDTVR